MMPLKLSPEGELANVSMKLYRIGKAVEREKDNRNFTGDRAGPGVLQSQHRPES
jgi:hypothetical protein